MVHIMIANFKSKQTSSLSGQESLLLENDVAVSTATSISKLNQGETSNNFLGAGDGVSSSLKASPHLPTQEQGDSFIRPRISSQDKVHLVCNAQYPTLLW